MMSLEELLSEEGFKRKGKFMARPAPKSVSMPLYLYRDGNPRDSRYRKGRTISDAYSRRSSSGLLWSSNGNESRNSDEIQQAVGSNRSRPQAPSSYGIREIEESGSEEIQEIEVPKDRYLLDKFQRNRSYKQKFSDDSRDREDPRKGKEEKFQATPSYRNAHWDERSEGLKSTDSDALPDRAAARAVVSILTGYIRRFFKDEKFRASVRHGCYICLGIAGGRESHHYSGGVVANLREAIKIVEKSVLEVPDPIDVKKASLKLSVITGLSSKDLKDGYTSGVLNAHLSACAHLYLSVIYKLRKKNKLSAKHLLQVFCESPHQARTVLLPGLWEDIFVPHLSHLRSWYNKETESMIGSNRTNLLDKVYNNTLDMGTYQFAVYYMDCVMEEAEASVLPSITIPSPFFPGITQEEPRLSVSTDRFASPHASVSSQSMVSKKLYESVFSRKTKSRETDEIKSREEEEVESTHCRSTGSVKREYDRNGFYHHDQGLRRGDYARDERIARIPSSDASPDAKKNYHTLALKKLAQDVFHPQLEGQAIDLDADTMECYSVHSPVTNLNENKLSNQRYTEPESKSTGTVSTNSTEYSFLPNSSGDPFGSSEDMNGIPKDFICPLTGNLFKDPVTLENGETFERAAIKEWFDRGNNTCPVTGCAFEFLSIPVTNLVLKSAIDDWKSEYCRNLLVSTTQISGNIMKHDPESKNESALVVIERLFAGFSLEEYRENAKHLISIGGLNFLVKRLELGDLGEKIRVSNLMLCCIKADGYCRSHLMANVSRPCILELLHSKQISARSNAVMLLIELTCLNRRTAITSFLIDLKTEEIVNTMHVLLVYLQSSPPEERVLVAVLLINLDLMVEPQKYSIYREEAVDSITMALDRCLSDKGVIANTRKALLMLGGHFSSSGEMLTENWFLKQAGFNHSSGFVPIYYEDESDEVALEEEEEAKEREEWMKNVSLVLLGSGKRSFLETLSNCLASESTELVSTCLTTAALLSHTLALLSIDAEIPLSVFSPLIPCLKDIINKGKHIKHKVLASLSLLNFSKIPECRVLLMESAKELYSHLDSFVDATWTAEELCNTIKGDDQEEN